MPPSSAALVAESVPHTFGWQPPLEQLCKREHHPGVAVDDDNHRGVDVDDVDHHLSVGDDDHLCGFHSCVSVWSNGAGHGFSSGSSPTPPNSQGQC